VCGTGDGEVFDAKVDPHNCPVIGGRLVGIGDRLAEAEMQVVVAVTRCQRGFCDLPLVAVEVLVLVAVFVVW